MEQLYNPPRFLTMELLIEVLSEFQWPAAYTLEDELLDCIIMRFPKSSLCFYEGFESDMGLFFLTSDTKTEFSLKIEHALSVLAPEAERDPMFNEPVLIDDISPFPSLEKVRNGLRDLCMLIQAYLMPCVEGDFSWVERYKAAISGRNK